MAFLLLCISGNTPVILPPQPFGFGRSGIENVGAATCRLRATNSRPYVFFLCLIGIVGVATCRPYKFYPTVFVKLEFGGQP